ncbi:MAG: FtsQ-type POTRA domain-containing protein [Desulfuromonadales bacterium]|nr:FtsQ-type POTRA domain-containing protein [Desulfuromonadales bacterium]
MLDMKGKKIRKSKENRPKKGKTPYDWKTFFQRGLRLILVSGSALLIVSGGFFAVRMLFESGYFGVEKIRIMNLKRLSSEEIVAESDIRGGDNIFNLNLEQIGKKIEENPWVARAEIERIFPREVVIRITEREARAIINLDYLYYVDIHGEIFKSLSVDSRLDYPVITGLNRDYFLNQQEKAEALLVKAVGLLDLLALNTVFTVDQISEIHIDIKKGFVLTTNQSGVPVLLGHDNFRQKLARLEKIYEDIKPDLASLLGIDLNVADRVIVKLDRKIT